MATILDWSLLKGFGDIFVWLLIFLVVYGVLEASNFLKNKGLHAIVSFAITAIVVISGGGTNIVTAMAPWAVVIAVTIFFVLSIGQFAGLETKQILSVFGDRGTIWYIIVPLFIIIVIAWTQGGSTEKTIVNEAGETITVEQPQRGFMEILTNPKVLGMILILLIAVMTLTLMGGGQGTIK